MATRWLLAIPALLLLAPLAQAEEVDVLGQSVDATTGVAPSLTVEVDALVLNERLQAQVSRDTVDDARAIWIDPLLMPDAEEHGRERETTRADEKDAAASPTCALAGPLELRLTFLPVACPLDALQQGEILPHQVLPRETPASEPEPLETTSTATPTVAGVAFPTIDTAGAAVALAGLAAVAAAGAAATTPSGTAASAALWHRARRLAWLLGAPLYTRLRRDSLLDHDARDALFQHLKAQPGTAISDLSKAAGIPRNTVTHHLHMMERQGLVTSLRKGRVRLYFPAGSAAEKRKADALAALRHDTTQALAREIGERPGLDQGALCERFGLAPSLAHWHVRRLIDSALVLQVRDGRHVRYYPGDAFHLVSEAMTSDSPRADVGSGANGASARPTYW